MTSLSGGATRAAAAAIVLGVVLAACGGTSNSGSGSGGSNNNGYIVPQGLQSTPDSPSPLPQAVAPGPQQAALAAPPPAAMAQPAPVGFQLMPVSGVTGTVTIQVTSASTFMLTVSASGMAPGSTHAVHIHFGNCPSAGVHIVALASMTANSAGMGTSTTTVHSAYKGDGRFLIVYAGPNPGPLAACAQLAG